MRLWNCLSSPELLVLLFEIWPKTSCVYILTGRNGKSRFKSARQGKYKLVAAQGDELPRGPATNRQTCARESAWGCVAPKSSRIDVTRWYCLGGRWRVLHVASASSVVRWVTPGTCETAKWEGRDEGLYGMPWRLERVVRGS